LDEGQQFESLVQGAETAWHQHERLGLLDEHQFASEEVLEVDELGISGDIGVCGGLEGQHDVYAERPVPPGALVAGLHDPGACAGDDHPSPVGDGTREVPGQRVFRPALGGPGGSEDCGLADVAVRGEHAERVAHLLEGGIGNLAVQTGDGILGKRQRGRHHLEHHLGVERVKPCDHLA